MFGIYELQNLPFAVISTNLPFRSVLKRNENITLLKYNMEGYFFFN